MLSESYKNRLLELAGVINEITSKEAFDKFYSDTIKFPALKGDEELFNKINDTIPIESNNQFNRGYFEWLYRLYSKGNLPINKLDKVKEYLNIFKSYINVIPQENRDINKFKSLDDLYNVVKEFEGKEEIIPTSKTQKIKEIKKEVKKVFNDGEWLVLVPTTERAACIVGKGTKWCTSADDNNMFDSYYEDGNLYIIIDKNNNKKYQLHIEKEELMDEEDRKVGPLLFFDYIAEGSDLADFFIKENKHFHKFILNEGIEELQDGGYSELFYEIFHDVYHESSKIDIPQSEKDEILNSMRDSYYNEDFIYYGFVYEENVDNIEKNQISELLESKYIEKEMLDRIFKHLREIEFDFEDEDINLTEYIKAIENLEKENKKTNVPYSIDKGYELTIVSIDVLNTEKPYKIKLQNKEKNFFKEGNVNAETLNNLFNQGILFEKK